MAGTLYQERPGGKWQFKIVIDGHAHKQSTKTHDYKQALRRATEIENQLRAGSFGWAQKKAITLGEWKPIYTKSYTARKKRPERDKQMFAHTERMLDNKRMDQITPADAEAYLAWRAQDREEVNPKTGEKTNIAGVKPWTIRRELGFMKAVWNRAIENAKTTGVIENPWRAVKAPKCHGRERVITLEEQAALMKHAQPRVPAVDDSAFWNGVTSRRVAGVAAARREAESDPRLVGKRQR